jgi:hypothetical protein
VSRLDWIVIKRATHIYIQKKLASGAVLCADHAVLHTSTLLLLLTQLLHAVMYVYLL